jgi:hypothetical protein
MKYVVKGLIFLIAWVAASVAMVEIGIEEPVVWMTVGGIFGSFFMLICE